MLWDGFHGSLLMGFKRVSEQAMAFSVGDLDGGGAQA
jgi:hypothetical protein